jgi:hypothetical protein
VGKIKKNVLIIQLRDVIIFFSVVHVLPYVAVVFKVFDPSLTPTPSTPYSFKLVYSRRLAIRIDCSFKMQQSRISNIKKYLTVNLTRFQLFKSTKDLKK